MRVPLRPPVRRAGREILAVVLVAFGAMLLAAILRRCWPTRGAMDRVDDLLYDSLYHARAIEDQSIDSDVAIIAIDEKSIDAMSRTKGFGWPWPREFWGILAQHLAKSGARAVVFDLILSERSVYQNESGDDDRLAELLDSIKMPVAFAVHVDADQPAGRFAPPIKRPNLGAANMPAEEVLRSYRPFVNDVPSLAVKAVELSGLPHSTPLESFLLHFYGPHESRDGRHTFRYVSAAGAIADALLPGNSTTKPSIDPAIFKDKIVLVGATFAGGYDLKASPLSKHYPGVEYVATATQNMLRGQSVIPIGAGATMLIAFLTSLIAAACAIAPRRASIKSIASACVVVALIVLAIALFRAKEIRWLPLALPLLSALFAIGSGFVWSYFTEARQRRFILKAFAQYVSPSVLAEMERNFYKVELGGQRREMTVMFTDIVGFTPLTESLAVEKVSEMLNSYFGEMSKVIFDVDGTLDKYLGDAIMSFWNAPLDQPDHAIRACRAALEVERRTGAVQSRAKEIGGSSCDVSTRVGINSGPMVVGNMGSVWRFDYTVVGDSVNYASRLEGANRFYNTRILLSEETAHIVADRFVVRKVDLLRAKGRRSPGYVYELLAEGTADAATRRRIDKYEQAFRLYQARQFDQARQMFGAIVEEFPHDGPAKVLLQRVERLIEHPPPASWDGSFDPGEK